MGIARIATLGSLTVAAAMLATATFAAAPDALDPEPSAAPPAEYLLDTVLIVHNWVLCVSETSAADLVRAREQGPEAAAQAYADLAAAKVCGRFAKLGVMLKQLTYRSGPGRDYETRAFSAMVNIGVGWQSGFVVAGFPE